MFLSVRPGFKAVGMSKKCPLLFALAFAACSTSSGNGVDGSSVIDGSVGSDAPAIDAIAGDSSAQDARSESSASVDAGGDTGQGGDAGAVATLFVPDDVQGTVKRYTISADADPVLTATIPVTGAACVALRSTGELLVSAYNQSGIVSRVSTPFGVPAANGTITLPGLLLAEETTFVDEELWIANYGGAGGGIMRVAFDGQGQGTAVGSIPISNNVRGLFWNATTRDLFVSECCATNAVRHFHVAPDHSTTSLPTITGNGLNNPHGMTIAPWGELLVPNFSGNSISRFTLDSMGNATPNGTITGNGLNGSADLQFAPWGELYVGNQGNCSFSRFTFDAAHNAVPHGMPFIVPAPGRCDWAKIL